MLILDNVIYPAKKKKKLNSDKTTVLLKHEEKFCTHISFASFRSFRVPKYQWNTNYSNTF